MERGGRGRRRGGGNPSNVEFLGRLQNLRRGKSGGEMKQLLGKYVGRDVWIRFGDATSFRIRIQEVYEDHLVAILEGSRICVPFSGFAYVTLPD